MMIPRLKHGNDREKCARIHMIAIRTVDRPGVLQTCARILAEAGVNIASSHVFHREDTDNRKEAQITIFAENYTPAVVERLRQQDFVLDVQVFELTCVDVVPDIVIFPTSLIQEAIREIALNYGEPVAASIFFRLGYMYGQCLAQHYIEALRHISNIELRLTALLNILKSLNLLKDYKIAAIDDKVILRIREPVEMRNRCLEKCYFTKGLLAGLLEKLLPGSQIVSESTLCPTREYEVTISLLPVS
ncbi:MAG: hypothetical protein GXO10_04285 [Crenarchaeota archaeon]|nr:hypothetical protein [Thermoproteota archaeon]